MPTRFESSVTAVSWIPSEAITGLPKIPFELGVTHYDEPPPDQIENLEELRTTDRFREANELRAFIEVEDGRIVRHGHLGQGHIGATTVRVGRAAIRFPAVHLPDIRPEPVVTATSVRFELSTSKPKETAAVFSTVAVMSGTWCFAETCG